MESLSAYARQFLGQMDKPDVDSIEGLSPAISIDQKTTSRNPRSTVGTVTEIYDYLRLLWARVGKPHCPICGRPIVGQSAEQIIDQVMELARGHPLHGARPGRAGAQGRVRQAAGGAARRRLRARQDRRPRAHARGVDRARQALQARHLGGRRPAGDAPRPAQAPGRLDRDGGRSWPTGWSRSRSSAAGRDAEEAAPATTPPAPRARARPRRRRSARARSRAGHAVHLLRALRLPRARALAGRARAADLLVQLPPRRLRALHGARLADGDRPRAGRPRPVAVDRAKGRSRRGPRAPPTTTSR